MYLHVYILILGLMFNVAFSTFEWKESKELFIQSRKSLKGFFNLLGMLVTFGLCYKVDMGIGIIAGTYIYVYIHIYKYIYYKIYIYIYIYISRLGCAIKWIWV
jgi:hypothetical protein